jgi:hypothetical protein
MHDTCSEAAGITNRRLFGYSLPGHGTAGDTKTLLLLPSAFGISIMRGSTEFCKTQKSMHNAHV